MSPLCEPANIMKAKKKPIEEKNAGRLQRRHRAASEKL